MCIQTNTPPISARAKIEITKLKKWSDCVGQRRHKTSLNWNTPIRQHTLTSHPKKCTPLLSSFRISYFKFIFWSRHSCSRFMTLACKSTEIDGTWPPDNANAQVTQDTRANLFSWHGAGWCKMSSQWEAMKPPQLKVTWLAGTCWTCGKM